MMTKIAASLLAVSLLTACQSTQMTTKRETMHDMNSRYASNANTPSNLKEPAPPAEGPEDLPPGASMDPMQNPALEPTPLLRDSAASGL